MRIIDCSSDVCSADLETHSETLGEPTRRDFLYLTTGMAGVVGLTAAAWPFIDQMRPDAATLALAATEVDVSALETGMFLTGHWRGKPVFIRSEERRVGKKGVSEFKYWGSAYH